MSLYDAVIQRWRAAFPSAAVDQLLAEEGAGVRAALDDAERLVHERRSTRKFHAWLDQQAATGREFDEVQLRWIDWMRAHVTARGELTAETLAASPFAQGGGPEAAARLFGRKALGDIMASLNTTLGTPKPGCACGGTCGCESCTQRHGHKDSVMDGVRESRVSDEDAAQYVLDVVPFQVDDYVPETEKREPSGFYLHLYLTDGDDERRAATFEVIDRSTLRITWLVEPTSATRRSAIVRTIDLLIQEAYDAENHRDLE